jgi:hypothetical protein
MRYSERTTDSLSKALVSFRHLWIIGAVGGYCQLVLREARCGPSKAVGSDSTGTRHLPPDAEETISQRSMVRSTDEVPPDAEQILDSLSCD